MLKQNSEYFIALTGAKKNVGDFLITKRALKLLKSVAPQYEYVVRPHWESLDEINFINNSKGIIILGGPGFQQNMYPRVYKLSKNLNDIKVPIWTLGTGWKGTPGDKTTEKLYEFTKNTKDLLDKLEVNSNGMSCRDYQTKRTLNNNGYKNVVMTGCPVWYDIDSINKEFKSPYEIKKIVFTPAQNEMFSEQSIDVMKYLKNKFAESKIVVSFHRGIGEIDDFTPESDAKNTQLLADKALEMGFEIADVSYDANKLDFYDDCDLHIGYRVHAHIYFLSKRLPSILLHEDGRGNGVTEALKSPGINGYKINKFYSGIFSLFNNNSKVLSIYRRLAYKIDKNIITKLDSKIDELENIKYAEFNQVAQVIDNQYEVMKEYIKGITTS